MQLAFSNIDADAKFRHDSESLHWAIRSGNFSSPPDGAFQQLAGAPSGTRARFLKALNRDALDALLANSDQAQGIAGSESVITAINRARGAVAATASEEHLMALIDGGQWKSFYSEFVGLNRVDQLRLLRSNFAVLAQFKAHIEDAKGVANLDDLRHLAELAATTGSTNLYVDAFAREFHWQPAYKAKPGELSRIIRFGDSFDIELDINESATGTLAPDEAQRQVDAAKPGRGGLLWPEQLNASTAPVLAKVKHDVHKQMETLLFDDVLAGGIQVVMYVITCLVPEAMNLTKVSLQALERATLSSRWMKGAQVVRGAAPVEAATGGAKVVGPGQSARTLAKKLADEGKPVVANIGGAGARHEPADAININNQSVARKNIPNLVEADGADIGDLFEPGTVDRVEAHNMAPGVVDWERAAPGINRALKPGGTIKYYTRGPDPDLQIAAQKLRDLGFKDVKAIGAPGQPPAYIVGTKP